MQRTKAEERIADEYLVAAAQLGDRKAFTLLARRWNRKLTAHAWRLLGDAESAADAVQEAWAEIVSGIARLEDPRAFPAWAYRIVSRRTAKIIGRAQRRRELAAAMGAEPVLAAREAEAESDIEKLRAAIRTLPAGQRAAIALFHLEEMSVAEVAVALDVPAGTVKTRLLHARNKLRGILQGEG